MAMIGLPQHGVSGEYDPGTAIIRRIGHIAGVVTISMVIFASLYFFVLFIGSK